MKYRLLVSWEAVEFIEKLAKADRQKLRQRLLAIAEYPQHFSDYSEADEVGRRIDVHICGKFAVKYWEDSADKDLKIVRIISSDRR